ncbi:SDR family oxidoreductase [Candidatus Kaiserbacteria bacterium]|nr:SDR family oxidoreductase [Candidatus Kaiserbacteria bacterium]
MKFKDASVVITGAARGLGAAIARELAKRKAQVTLSDIESRDLSDVGAELDMPTMHCDVTNRDQIEALGRAAIDEYGKIDLWINNAGVWMPYTPAEDLDFSRAHQLVEVNYFGTAYGILEAVKHMQEREGVILNILSVRALKGKALGAAYSASKFAAEGFMQGVRDELKGTGIKVIGVYPYRIKTNLFGENKHDDYEQSMEPADVARIIVDNLAEEHPSEHLEIWKIDDVRKQ